MVESFYIDRRNTLEVRASGDIAVFSLIRVPHETAQTKSIVEFSLTSTEVRGLLAFLREASDA
jgi:hypothetical protein